MHDTYILLTTVLLSIILIVIGMALILVGSIRSNKREVEAGGAVIIGPLPIVFGTSTRMLITVLILAIILTALVIILHVISWRGLS